MGECGVAPDLGPMRTTGSLAYAPMNSLLHRPFRQVLVLVIHAFAHVLLLDRRRSGLERCQIHLVRVHQLLCDGQNVRDQAVQQVHRHALAHHNPQDLRLVALRGQWVVCNC